MSENSNNNTPPANAIANPAAVVAGAPNARPAAPAAAAVAPVSGANVGAPVALVADVPWLQPGGLVLNCMTCDRKFDSVSAMVRHLMFVHPPFAEDRFVEGNATRAGREASVRPRPQGCPHRDAGNIARAHNRAMDIMARRGFYVRKCTRCNVYDIVHEPLPRRSAMPQQCSSCFEPFPIDCFLCRQLIPNLDILCTHYHRLHPVN